MSRKKTIFVTVFHSFITKNILNTKVFSLISEHKELKIVLLVPDVKYGFFVDLYTRDNVEVISVPVNKIINNPRAKLLSSLFRLLIDSHYLWYKRRERLEARKNVFGLFKYIGESVFVFLFSPLRFLHPFWRFLFQTFGHSSEVADLFKKYTPEHVFVTDAFDESDILFAREARKRGIHLISMVRSWDNCYSKGLLRTIPNEMVVNNKTIADELISLHDISRDSIHVLGAPQYDSFVLEPRTPREVFFKETGVDPTKKLIVFAPAGAILSDTDWQIATIFKEAIDNKLFSFPVQFLIRNHPNHPANLDAIQGRDDMIIENPGKVFNKNNPKETELTRGDNDHLADVLYYADVVIYVATTLGLDSMVFNKPQIVVNFDGWEKDRPYIRSVRRYHNEDHMKKMLDCGGVTVTKNKDELVESINHYLRDPSWNQKGRDLVVEQQFYNLDGKAGERIGNYLLSKFNF